MDSLRSTASGDPPPELHGRILAALHAEERRRRGIRTLRIIPIGAAAIAGAFALVFFLAGRQPPSGPPAARREGGAGGIRPSPQGVEPLVSREELDAMANRLERTVASPFAGEIRSLSKDLGEATDLVFACLGGRPRR